MPKLGQDNLPNRWAKGGKYLYVLIFFGLALAYLGLSLIPKPDERVLRLYHLTNASYRWLLYPAVFLLFLSWVFSLIGSLGVKSYSNLIRGSRDGKALTYLSSGFLVLTISQPLSSVLSNIFTHVEKHTPNATESLTILNNYLSVIWVAVALSLIAVGAKRLCGLVTKLKDPIPPTAWTFGFIVFSSVYSYFLVIQPIHTPLARRIYYLPDWLLVLSIGVPYLFFWYLGSRAAYQLYLYQSSVNGKLYKLALRYLAAGVAVVIVSSIANRSITTISAKLSQLSLTPILFIIYALFAINALGFILIAIGASKLRRIEEV